MNKENLNAKLDVISERISAMRQATETHVEQRNDAVKDQLDTAKGNVTAARENMRLASEKGKSKVNSALLQIQASIDKLKEDAEAAKASHDQARELFVVEDAECFAEEMLELAVYHTEEAAYAVMHATQLRNQYSEKYGK